MIRIVAAALLALALTAPVLAKDRIVHLTLDGRAVDRAGGIALVHRGIVYADVVDLVKSFDGLLIFHGAAVEVTIRSKTARFTVGSRTMQIGQGSVVMGGQAFRRNGDIYVPLEAFVTRVAGARMRTNADKTRAQIFVNANPMS